MSARPRASDANAVFIDALRDFLGLRPLLGEPTPDPGRFVRERSLWPQIELYGGVRTPTEHGEWR